MRPIASGMVATAWFGLACSAIACVGNAFTAASAVEGDGAADASPSADGSSGRGMMGPDAFVEAGPANGDDAVAPVDASMPPADAPVAPDAPANVATCPSGRGPSMVLFDGFCIDSTEVTEGQYNDFLLANPSTATTGQPPECSWNTSYLPGGGWAFAAAQSQLPIANVDWCDAYAFCAWAGKRLCGKVGGGAASFASFAGADNEHYVACSNMGARLYPYGNTYDSTACNGAAHGGGQLLPAGSLSTCQGGVPGLFDMSGNVEEWQDACRGQTGASDPCLDGTGAFDYGSGSTGTRCDFADSDMRNSQLPDVGIRCCATP